MFQCLMIFGRLSSVLSIQMRAIYETYSDAAVYHIQKHLPVQHVKHMALQQRVALHSNSFCQYWKLTPAIHLGH